MLKISEIKMKCDNGKYLNMTRIKKLMVETQNTTYEIEVENND